MLAAVYAPLEGEDENLRAEFLKKLSLVLNACEPCEQTILLRNMNGWVCTQGEYSESVFGRNGNDKIPHLKTIDARPLERFPPPRHHFSSARTSERPKQQTHRFSDVFLERSRNALISLAGLQTSQVELQRTRCLVYVNGWVYLDSTANSLDVRRKCIGNESSLAADLTDGPNIPGPYINPEETESFPLKRYLYGNAQTAARGCCSYFTGDDGGVGSLRTIIFSFITLTLAVTIALRVPHGSVATDSHKCSVLGTDILKKGGNAVDAAIASTLCVGIFNPHVTGLGGVGIQVPSSLVAAHWHLDSISEENAKLVKLVDLLEAGQNLPMPSLANTLELIALQGPEAFYNGALADDILSTIFNAGGIMTAKDLSSYQPIRRPTHHIQFSNFDLYVPGPPAAGLFLESVLGDPSFLNISNQSEINEPLSDNSWDFPEAVGSHVAAVDLDDLYVSVVSGLNTWYGSQLLTDGGFILNNALENFGIGSNSPAPGKRPFTLAVPMIAVQHDHICGRRLVLGAGDATVAIQLLTRLLAFGDNATLGVEAPRFRVAHGGTFLKLEASLYVLKGAKRGSDFGSSSHLSGQKSRSSATMVGWLLAPLVAMHD
uniref:(California timema) hypothetical protein n=1 Tax=Timema californicum TaxID=61474 RepID=A0A7R9J5Q8_TIMCA|nr:unnamed protein product [Timema californicum]